MANPIPPIPIKTPLINPQTGMMNQAWIRYINALVQNIKDLQTRVTALGG